MLGILEKISSSELVSNGYISNHNKVRRPLQNSKSLFSSPEPKARVSYCRPFLCVVRRASCVVRRLSSVNFLHFHLLLENAWLDFNQTWQES